jgi:hypothetical protein
VIAFVDLTRCFIRSTLGSTMSNLAATYGLLERHQDALVLQEKALEFFRRVLPENHPHIGAA